MVANVQKLEDAPPPDESGVAVRPDASTQPVQMTPMMAQYHEIKSGHSDSLLFYRMGDFYELFFDDAVKAAEALSITLTKRGRHLGEDIPMCGVPVHAADDYLQRLIKKGFRVAVCEQVEAPADAKKRGAKSVVQRDIVRHVTPGTLTEDSLLDGRSHNYLASVARIKSQAKPFAIAWVDISTGELAVAESDAATLGADLSRLDPSEIILADTLLDDPEFGELWPHLNAALTPLPAGRFDSQNAERRLKDFFSVAALDGFGEFSRTEIAACGTLIDYVAITQVGHMPAIRPPERERQGATMVIDQATRTNLEIVRTLSGERKGSLLSVIDRTVTGAGARKLAERLAAPLVQPDRINARLDAVAFCVDAYQVRDGLRLTLRACPDLGRALGRLTVGRGGPRDLGAIRDGLGVARTIPGETRTSGLVPVPALLSHALARLEALDGTLESALAASLGEDLPLLARDGGFIAGGYDSDLDDCRTLRDESRKVIAGLQTDYATLTGLKSLKIKHNNVLGYFIEVPAQHGDGLMNPPHNETFIHRQTLANAMRFTTTELSGLQSRISQAADRARAIELGIFEKLLDQVERNAPVIADVADALAELDVASALAELAQAARYIRPVVDDSTAFRIRDGRHPVVEAALAAQAESGFIPNDCNLEATGASDPSNRAGAIWLLTGPNMAGKSTFLRQNALIAILAQIGSFVPADEAHIGVVDRVFSRVGAADDLARGRSTFMVEMVETATILNQAGPRSLVILDEIGRGTATYDGLSIAWACVEHLHEQNRCRALFATHFHEMTALSETMSRLVNVTMKVKEWQGDIIFLHEVGRGAADRSYGIHVARLAGLPDPVIERAGDVLAALERNEQSGSKVDLVEDLPLFSASRPQSPTSAQASKSAVETALEDIHADDLTPREALDLMYTLKSLLKGS